MMIVNRPMFDVTSPDLKLGTAVWVVSREVLRAKRKKFDDEQNVRSTAAIIQDVSPLSVRLTWYDPSVLEQGLITIRIEQVTNGEYTLAPMVPRIDDVKGGHKLPIPIKDF